MKTKTGVSWYEWLEENVPNHKVYVSMRAKGLFANDLSAEEREAAIWSVNAHAIHGSSEAIAKYWN